MPDAPDLLQAIDDLGATPWTGKAYRHTAPEYQPLSGAGAAAIGGRWNPRDVYTIYLALPEEACLEEFMRLARGQARGVASFLPRDLHVVQVSALEVLDLSVESARKAVGISQADIESDDRSLCQDVGRAAYFLGLQGILAPSATRAGFVLAAFERNVRRSQLTVIETRPLSLTPPDE